MKVNNAIMERAMRSGSTGFGGESAGRGASMALELQHKMKHRGLEEYFRCRGSRTVQWLIHGDGTATCQTDGLTWIQAPWGMQWAGGIDFSGEMVRLPWLDACRLFGRGQSVGLSDAGTIALSAAQIGSTTAGVSYSRGTCRVEFAGRDDWRLPTVAEYHTLIGLWSADGSDQVVFPRFRSDDSYWSANRRSEFVPEWIVPMKSRVAWAANLGRSICDEPVQTPHGVMFVRSA